MTVNYTWFIEDNSETSYTDTSWTQRLTKTFIAPATGDYLIMASWCRYQSSTSTVNAIRVQLDDSTTICAENAIDNVVGSTTNYRNGSTFYLAEDLASGSHHVDLDSYIDTGTGYIKYMKIVIIRMDDWAVYNYVATEGPTSITSTSTSWQNVCTINSVTYAQYEWLLLATTTETSGSANYSVNARINVDDGTEFAPVESTEEASSSNHASAENQASSTKNAWTWGTIYDEVSYGSNTYYIQINRSSASASSASVSYTRLLMLRITSEFYHDNTAKTNTSTTNTTYSVDIAAASILAGAIASQYFLYMGGFVGKPDATTYSAKGRLSESTFSTVVCEANWRSKDAATPADAIPMFSFTRMYLTSSSYSYSFVSEPANVTSATMYYKGGFGALLKVSEDPVTPGYSHDINAVVSSSISSSNEIPSSSISSFNNVIGA